MRTIIALSLLCLLAHASQAQPCKTPLPLALYRWDPSAEAKLYYQPGDFTPEERRELSKAVSAWAPIVDRFGIRLTEAETGSILVRRDVKIRGGHAGELRGESRDGYTSSAVISLASGRRDVLAHELGHAFGLNDCPSCKPGETVMALFYQVKVNWLPLFQRHGAGAPTRCDEQALDALYRRKEESARQAPEVSAPPRRATEISEAPRPRLTPPAPGDGHPSELLLYRRQGELLKALSSRSFMRETVAEEIGSGGKLIASHRMATRLYMGNDLTPKVAGKAPAFIKLGAVTVSRLDSGSLWLPPFVHAPRYLGRDGALYVYAVTGRLDGMVWTDGEGNVIRAEGTGLCPDLVDGEKMLRFRYEAEGGLPRSAAVEQEVKDKHGRGHRLRLVTRFSDYKQHRAEEPRVLDIDDVEGT